MIRIRQIRQVVPPKGSQDARELAGQLACEPAATTTTTTNNNNNTNTNDNNNNDNSKSNNYITNDVTTNDTYYSIDSNDTS